MARDDSQFVHKDKQRFIALARDFKNTVKADPSKWRDSQVEDLKYILGPDYGHWPVDIIRRHCENARRRGELGRHAKGGHGATKLDPVPDWLAEYYLTEHWKKTSRGFIDWIGHCQVWKSGAPCAGPLNVHHNNYDCLYKETIKDVIVLCRHHHVLIERDKKNQRRRADASKSSLFDAINESMPNGHDLNGIIEPVVRCSNCGEWIAGPKCIHCGHEKR